MVRRHRETPSDRPRAQHLMHPPSILLLAVVLHLVVAASCNSNVSHHHGGSSARLSDEAAFQARVAAKAKAAAAAAVEAKVRQAAGERCTFSVPVNCDLPPFNLTSARAWRCREQNRECDEVRKAVGFGIT